MDKRMSPIDYVMLAYKGLTTGPVHEKIFYLFILVSAFFGAVAFYDGINGRNCNKGFTANDPMSYLSAPACFMRGFIEPLPRARGWEGRGNKRP